jgi:nicotinamidase-related amidase
MKDWKEATALVVIDVQKGFDDAAHWGGERNNPECEDNIAKLLAAWRSEGWPVVFVRHDSASPDSPLRAGSDGNTFKDVVSGKPDLLVTKNVHSAFYGDPDLHGWLQERGIGAVAICGIQTNMCCETTARMASDLGYEVLFVMDATYTFDIEAPNHQVYRAREIARYTGLNLADGFAQVVRTKELLE